MRVEVKVLESGTDHPNVPFSGHKNSGIGIEFGEDGLKEFCNLQVIANRRWAISQR